ncbi:bifunctional (p)ppGpp synthetase/guanosine-3',5'-bis(diphosphate) 3'-pyrophosphohydrolase [Candidatus Sumerlaeota bacterium]|nr:bifunctional (p)ppGpp synthetase/guanosine-3',5'-bis(diphosphate) 3'-pyrophosphohydrolase [Candidatus Sumerlaeota bacterium]
MKESGRTAPREKSGLPLAAAQAADAPRIPSVDEALGKGLSRFSATERDWIRKAYETAVDAHDGQVRLSGEPYVVHSAATARTLLDMGMDWATVCGALLHDTIEDTRLTYRDLKERFPDPIADLVQGVTKVSSLNFRSSYQEQAENLRKMVLAMAKDIRVILIKLADRRHNVQTLHYLPPNKQRRIARSTMEIYAPLASRLGVYRLKSELEDGAMRYLYPAAYRELSRKIAQRRGDRERHIEKSILFLKNLLAEHGLQAEVTGRSKHFWSVFQKMRKQNLTFEEIYDLNALRVICNTRQECYEAVGLIHSVWRPVPEHFSDYIAMPKPNLYQSIHTKVVGLDGQLSEIQVRTRDMHRVAEEGVAAHWRYKEADVRVSQEFDSQLLWLRQMVDWLQDTNDPDELIHDLKRDSFSGTVFCFTPRGDVVELAQGATVLDFAYHIHTELGHKCTGGKVNQKFVPMRAKLKTGDLVEIVAAKTQHPSMDWLQIVTSPRARNKIRHWLKQRDYVKNVQLGRETIAKALSAAGVHVTHQELSDVLGLHLIDFHVKTVDDLYAEVGFGAVPTTMVVARFLPVAPEAKPPPRAPGKVPRKPTEVLVDGMPGYLTRFAQCCKPNPGDPISGFVTRGRGVSVHHSECSHLARWIAQSTENRRRLVRVSWAGDAPEHNRVSVRISFVDRAGILRDLAETISAMNIMIVASNSRSNMRSHRAFARFTVLIKSSEDLNALMNRLREVPDVQSVTRDSKTR